MGTREEEDPGEGILSDDSDFYGDESLRVNLSDRATIFNPSTYWENHHLELSVIAYTTTAKATATTSTMATSLSTPKPKKPTNPYEGQLCGRQLSEPISEFLDRLPPQTTSITSSGPWIYIANPHSPPTHHDWSAFTARGHELLKDYEALAQGIEASMPGKPKGTITRKLTPLRTQLSHDIFTTAKEKGCVSGKWMLFPSPSRVNHYWSLIAAGTANGELGHAAKVATDDGSGGARLICVYTEDSGDRGDVRRVLERLVEMGLVGRNGAMGEGWAVYYKADAFTYLDVMSGNVWGLKPSLYSSREVLGEGK